MARFVYYNRNPQLNTRKNDCVCRAISFATNLPYTKIEEKLKLTAELYECDRLDMCCYKTLLQDVFKLRPIRCKYLTVGELADKFPKSTIIARTNGHLTAIKRNTVYDIFDCRNELVTNAWAV